MSFLEVKILNITIAVANFSHMAVISPFSRTIKVNLNSFTAIYNKISFRTAVALCGIAEDNTVFACRRYVYIPRKSMLLIIPLSYLSRRAESLFYSLIFRYLKLNFISTIYIIEHNKSHFKNLDYILNSTNKKAEEPRALRLTKKISLPKFPFVHLWRASRKKNGSLICLFMQ